MKSSLSCPATGGALKCSFLNTTCLMMLNRSRKYCALLRTFGAIDRCVGCLRRPRNAHVSLIGLAQRE